MDETQYVMLEDGNSDGQVRRVPAGAAPSLRVGVELGGERWTELYLTSNGRTVDDPEHGTIPVLVFRQRLHAPS
jgi:hypothetical protein